LNSVDGTDRVSVRVLHVVLPQPFLCLLAVEGIAGTIEGARVDIHRLP
jgi:hypothetical protein